MAIRKISQSLILYKILLFPIGIKQEKNGKFKNIIMDSKLLEPLFGKDWQNTFDFKPARPQVMSVEIMGARLDDRGQYYPPHWWNLSSNRRRLLNYQGAVSLTVRGRQLHLQY